MFYLSDGLKPLHTESLEVATKKVFLFSGLLHNNNGSSYSQSVRVSQQMLTALTVILSSLSSIRTLSFFQ